MEQKSNSACFIHDVLLLYTVQNISLQSISGLNMRTYRCGSVKRKRNVYDISEGVNTKKENCLGVLERKEEAKNNGMK